MLKKLSSGILEIITYNTDIYVTMTSIINRASSLWISIQICTELFHSLDVGINEYVLSYLILFYLILSNFEVSNVFYLKP